MAYDGKDYERLLENENGEVVVMFKNGFSILSNLHYTPFVVEGTRYRSVEQYIYAKKALMFKDYTAYQGIMEEKCARKYKDCTITGYYHNRDILREGLRAKFEQCERFKERLENTSDAMIVYTTTHDRIMGSGLDLLNDDNMIAAKWEGNNELGRALRDVRAEYAH